MPTPQQIDEAIRRARGAPPLLTAPTQAKLEQLLQGGGRPSFGLKGAKIGPGGMAEFPSPGQEAREGLSRLGGLGDAFARGVVGLVPRPGEINEAMAMLPTPPGTSPLLNALIAAPMAEQLLKAKEAKGVERLGRLGAGLLPLVGPAAASAGESLGSLDPLHQAEGLGQTFSLLAPLAPGAARGAGEVASQVKRNAAAPRSMGSQAGALRMGQLQELAEPKGSPFKQAMREGYSRWQKQPSVRARQTSETMSKLSAEQPYAQMEANLQSGKPLWEGELSGPPGLEQNPGRRVFFNAYLSPKANELNPGGAFRDIRGLGQALQGAYAEHGLSSAPQYSTSGFFNALYDLGQATQGPLKGKGVMMRVSAEPAMALPKEPWLVPIQKRGVTPEGLRYDIVERLRPPSAEERLGKWQSDFSRLLKEIEASGYDPTDLTNNPGNALYTADGRLVVSDPGAVVPKKVKLDFEQSRYSSKQTPEGQQKQRLFFETLAQGLGLAPLTGALLSGDE